MKHWLVGLLLLIGAAGRWRSRRARHRLRFGPRSAEAADGHVFRRGDRRRGQFQGPRVRILPRQHHRAGLRRGGGAAARIRRDGKFIREIGKNLYAWSFAHAVRIDAQDNIWVIDKGSDMVVKFNPAGRVVMVFGRKKEASDEDTEPLKHPNPPLPPVDGLFRQVTDVAWDTAGNTYISDGYINSRVAKVDKDGNWMKSWGERGNGPGQFNTPHAIAADAKGNIYVADRGNRRIQVFDSDGKFLREFASTCRSTMRSPRSARCRTRRRWPGGTLAPGAPWAVCITPRPNQVLYTSDAFPGRIYKLTLDGKVLGVLGESGKQLKQFGWIHEIACPSENQLYVAELLNWRVQKLILKP